MYKEFKNICLEKETQSEAKDQMDRKIKPYQTTTVR